ncbi:MAG TPA: flagellar export protein FliJ [Steroidobacteraceae bacterium]|jgi:flagellar FliJ protein|nr:flagellar export protein FliJ [Steroidobacteraceae bacterium]
MKRSDRLDVVQQVASRNERERAERVGAAERHLVEMQQKLAALEKYRTEYEAGFKARAGSGVDVVGMRDFQTFLAKLGEALTQQRELVTLAQRALDTERSSWREAAQRAHVVETLAERWQSEELRAATRRDQNESDELSQQRANKRER